LTATNFENIEVGKDIQPTCTISFDPGIYTAELINGSFNTQETGVLIDDDVKIILYRNDVEVERYGLDANAFTFNNNV
jgi:hypothetical protein